MKSQTGKKIDDCAVRTVCTDANVAGSYSDMWHVYTATHGTTIQ
jgi:hypothetical protein